MGKNNNLTKLFEHDVFMVYQTSNPRKIKTLTKPLFKKTPKEICKELSEIKRFTEQNVKLLKLLLQEERKAYFFFDRGDGELFAQIHGCPVTDDSPSYGNISIHQLSWSKNFIPAGSLLFIPINK